MTDEPPPQAVAADASLAGLLDLVCDLFEKGCKSGTPPRLETFLGDLPPAAAERGFRELLELELAYRRRAGQTPTADEYRSRFPQYSDTIERLLQPAAARLPAAGPFAETLPARMAGSFSDVVPADTQIASGGAPARSAQPRSRACDFACCANMPRGASAKFSSPKIKSFIARWR
jgi:hypothetical protein